tara:strand:+ start:274 stop:444 length:171 start_codon:yes stop_codon:yes gene_type:complete
VALVTLLLLTHHKEILEVVTLVLLDQAVVVEQLLLALMDLLIQVVKVEMEVQEHLI